MITIDLRIAVVFAAFNGARWIPTQVTSILEQQNVNPSIFISIDSSTDNSTSLSNSLSKKYDNITVIPSYAKYGDAAKNFFRLIHYVDFTDFDYVAFSDQDDIWNHDKLTRAVDELNRTGAAGYSSNVTAFWPDGKTLFIDKAQPQVQWDYLFESAGPGCTFVMTKALALELQSFVRINYAQMQSVWLHDWFTYAFARAHGYRWHIDPQSTMQYRQHAHNQVGVNKGLKAFKQRAAFIIAGKWFQQVELVTTLIGQHENDFVKQWLPFSRFGFLKLAFSAHKCRRKRSDQLWFFMICLLMALIGVRSQPK